MMTDLRIVRRWFLRPAIAGHRAQLLALAAVLVPTIIRASVQGPVSGIPLLTYFPFVLLAAIALGWRHAAVVAVASALVGSLMFIEPRFIFLAGPTDYFAIIVFLVGSAMMIRFVAALKGVVVHAPGSPVARHRRGIVFSSEGGDAWASWHGDGYSVRLGSQDEVAEMMRDFLAQRELGKQLAR